MRKVIPALVILGLALGAWLLWPRDADVPTTTVPEAGATSTTTSTQVTSTTSTDDPTTSTVADSHVVETVAEAEEILRNHYSIWFRGIYHQDETLIRETVVSQQQIAAAVSQFGSMRFIAEPTTEGLNLEDVDILRSDPNCLAIWATVSADFRDGSTSGVVVMRWTESGWKMLSSWTLREDLWEDDCESQL